MLKLREASLDWALAHVEQFGDTDIFPTPFEFGAIRLCWEDLKSELAGTDMLGWIARPTRSCLSPKHRFGFRVSPTRPAAKPTFARSCKPCRSEK